MADDENLVLFPSEAFRSKLKEMEIRSWLYSCLQCCCWKWQNNNALDRKTQRLHAQVLMTRKDRGKWQIGWWAFSKIATQSWHYSWGSRNEIKLGREVDSFIKSPTFDQKKKSLKWRRTVGSRTMGLGIHSVGLLCSMAFYGYDGPRHVRTCNGDLYMKRALGMWGSYILFGLEFH